MTSSRMLRRPAAYPRDAGRVDPGRGGRDHPRPRAKEHPLDIRNRQAPLRERYTNEPSTAIQRLAVHGGRLHLSDPLHVDVRPDPRADVTWQSGAHPAAGADEDVPCSGDLLFFSLAAR